LIRKQTLAIAYLATTESIQIIFALVNRICSKFNQKSI